MTKTRKSRRKVGGSVENVHNTDPLVIASELKNIVTNIMNIMILKFTDIILKYIEHYGNKVNYSTAQTNEQNVKNIKNLLLVLIELTNNPEFMNDLKILIEKTMAMLQPHIDLLNKIIAETTNKNAEMIKKMIRNLVCGLPVVGTLVCYSDDVLLSVFIASSSANALAKMSGLSVETIDEMLKQDELKKLIDIVTEKTKQIPTEQTMQKGGKKLIKRCQKQSKIIRNRINKSKKEFYG
jgi:hypothetical protein